MKPSLNVDRILKLGNPGAKRTSTPLVDQATDKLKKANIVPSDFNRNNAMAAIPPTVVNSITYTMVDPDSARWSSPSVVEVTEDREYEEEGRERKPIRGGLSDPRIGPSFWCNRCETCQGTLDNCNGHDAIIKLKQPVYHPLEHSVRTIVAVLNSVCENENCRKVLMSKSRINEILESSANHLTALETIAKESAKLTCDNCKTANNRHYIKLLVDNLNIISYKIDDRTVSETPANVRRILSQIPPDQISLLGFKAGHPKLLVLTIIPVPPPRVRWPNTFSGEYHPDDITIMLTDIIKANRALSNLMAIADDPRSIAIYESKRKDRKMKNKNKKGSDVPVVGPAAFDYDFEQAMTTLQIKVSFMIDNRQGVLKKQAADKYEGVVERVTGKEGLTRSTFRKRGDGFLRTVAGNGAFVPFGWVELPEKSRHRLTFPETVTTRNIGALKELLVKGEISSIQYRTGPNMGLITHISDRNRANIQLNYGDRVRRWLQEGDWVILNRQPTLHTYSMMGVRAKFVKDRWGVSPSTIRMNPSTTTPYNADFDGDELNIWVPQTYESRAEIAQTMALSKNMMNAQTNINTMGLTQDAVVGSYLASDPSSYVDPGFFSSLAALVDDFDLLDFNRRLTLHNVDEFSGRAVVSLALPADFTYEKGEVVIKDGILIKGRLSKTHMATGERTIPLMIWMQYGEDVTAKFMTEYGQIMYTYITERGYTIDLSDCIPQRIPKSMLDDKARIEKQIAEIETAIQSNSSFAMIQGEINSEIERIETDIRTKSPYTSQFGSIDYEVMSTLLQDKSDKLVKLNQKRSAVTEQTALKELQNRLVQLRADLVKYQTLTPLKAQQELVNMNFLRARTAAQAITIQKQQATTDVQRNRYEEQIKMEINMAAQRQGAALLETILPTNKLGIAVDAGAKGSELNKIQIMSSVGPQFYRSKRLEPSTYSVSSDPGLEARGNCQNSWTMGLTPQEYCSIHDAGREGLTDLSTKTADTGYSESKLMRIMEDYVVTSSGMVVNTYGRIVSYSYGGDLFDPAKLYKTTGPYGAPRAVPSLVPDLAKRLAAKAGY